MELTWVPSEAKGENPKLVGQLKVKAPGFKVRAQFKARFAALPLDESEGASKEEIAKRRTGQLEGVADLWESARSYVSSVQLTHVESGQRVNSVEELDVAPWCETVISELVVAFVIGLEKN